ncbi:MAG: Spy/CpxP family protein refolding chaperone [Candidatus Omnitrophica bacterium]|nr:Spy/CpxP family protein refolding chaperone [Candidatus Omnitrophota bacterium]
MRKARVRFLCQWFLYLFVIVFVLTSVNIFSQGSSGQTQEKKTILDYKAEVGLTEKQVKEIGKLITDYEKRVSGNLEKIKEKDKELKDLLASEGDIKEIGKLVREIYRLRGEIVVDALETGRKIDQMLTKEQKAKWKEIKAGISQSNEKQGGKE